MADRLNAVIARAGLASAGRDGPFDRMRGRIVFPIMDETGRVIGFGGRAMLEGQEPKYLNTAETPVYRKSNSLYLLHAAKEPIRKAGRAVLVEGYFDAVALHAAGFEETVAVLGTALTETQLKLLRRFTATLLIVYDEDAGGNEAAVRGLDLATEAGFEVKVVRLPGATDPDEFLAAHGRDAMERALADAAGSEAAGGAVSLFAFRMDVAARRADPATLPGRKAIVAALLPFLARVPNAIERYSYVQQLAGRLGVREQDVDEEVTRFLARPAPTTRPTPIAPGPAATPPLTAAWRTERLLLQGVVRRNAAAVEAWLGLTDAHFSDPASARLAVRLRELFAAGQSFSAAGLMDEFQDQPAIVDLLATAEGPNVVGIEAPPQPEGGEGSPAEGGTAPAAGAYREAADQLRHWYNRGQLKDVQRQLERATDPAAIVRLLEAKQRLASGPNP